MMKSILSIAVNTFKETIRDRILYVILVFSVIIPIIGLVLGHISVGNSDKMVLDFGLAGISISGTIIAMFIGTSIISKEIEKKTIYVMITKPIDRYEFIFGKYLGLMLTLTMAVCIMGVIFISILYLFQSNLVKLPFILLSLYHTLVMLFVLTAIALLLSTFTNHLLSLVLTVCIWGIGHLNPLLLSLKDYVDVQPVSILVTALHHIMPDFSVFNIINQAHAPLTINVTDILLMTLYGGCYSLIVILIAVFSLNQKEFI